MVGTNLRKGLERLGIPYRLNDYKYIKRHPEEIACIIGKPHVLYDHEWKNPILFGAGIFSHPIECPDLFEKYPNVQNLLVPGEWARKMYATGYGDKVLAWPVGTDTEYWKPSAIEKSCDFLVYDKIMWNYDVKKEQILSPILQTLKNKGLSHQYMRYGKYMPDDLLLATQNCKAVIFLCEHETQGLAYQQILATDTPILGWDQGEYWLDPYYYPHKVKYGPVSSLPYWDERCGEKFKAIENFDDALHLFQSKLKQEKYSPRDYILENLTLEKCAEHYVAIHQAIEERLAGKAGN
jgi:hypothetical protein